MLQKDQIAIETIAADYWLATSRPKGKRVSRGECLIVILVKTNLFHWMRNAVMGILVPPFSFSSSLQGCETLLAGQFEQLANSSPNEKFFLLSHMSGLNPQFHTEKSMLLTCQVIKVCFLHANVLVTPFQCLAVDWHLLNIDVFQKGSMKLCMPNHINCSRTLPYYYGVTPNYAMDVSERPVCS